MAVMFESQFARLYDPEKRKRFPSIVGKGLKDEFTAAYNKDGTISLVKTGEHDLYADIQSHKDSCDLQTIIRQYFNGDPAALSRVQGVYMDVTAVPDNIHEAMQLIDNARKDFDSLPVDVKQKFDNDANKFLASLGTADWFEKMQVAQSANSDPVASVVESAQKDGD